MTHMQTQRHSLVGHHWKMRARGLGRAARDAAALVVPFLGALVLFPTQGEAQVACAPDPGYTTCRAYVYTGADQALTVPPDVTAIKVKAWGAGAGGSSASPTIGAPGGSGGYVEGVLVVTPGSQYVVMTGEGGGGDGMPGSSTRCAAAYGFGGACAPIRGGAYVDGGGGGGLSGLFAGAAPVLATDNARAVLIAGGAGAGEGTNSCGVGSAAGGAGGNAFAGTMPDMRGVTGAFNGLGGSNPTGGGGGYLGGAGTGRLSTNAGCPLTSANGGSNFVALGVSATANLPGSEAPSVPNLTVKNPPRTTEPQYLAGVGVGTATVGLVGGDGLVIVQWAQPPLNTCTPPETRATQRYWFFGQSGGIDFGTTGTTATPILGNSSNNSEGSTVVTDSGGQLQFWSNGQSVFDRNGNAMPNGTGLLGAPSATQTVAAFPALGQPGKYFVVTTSTDVFFAATGPNNQLYYSVVDMSLNGGLGDVVAAQKNLSLGADNTASEALTAVPNADGTGFWVITYTNGSTNILAYEFDSNGPTGPVTTSTLPSANGNLLGTLNFSADLTQLVAMTGTSTSGLLRLLAFDAATGQITQRLSWSVGAPVGTVPYSADFSPSGDYVYASNLNTGGRLYRYHIAGATTGAQVKLTEEDLGTIDANSPVAQDGGQVRRGPDGRMYVAAYGTGTISVVNTPDAVSPGFVEGGFALAAGAISRYGLPQTVTGCPVPTSTDLSITKTDNSSRYAPGTNVTYSVVVANNGPLVATGASVSDPLPAGITTASWTCATTAGGGACGAPSGTGGINTTANLPVGGSVTYTLTMTVPTSFSSNLVNTAIVSPPPGLSETNSANNTAIDTDTLFVPALQTCTPDQVRLTQRHWFFGTQAGLDFGAAALGPPTGVTGAGSTPEGSTVVTDTLGQLQFWSNGTTIYNRNNQPMPNGTGLLGNPSATQTVAAFPAMGRPGVHFVVTTDSSHTAAQLRYSEVDMSLNGGLGDVVAGRKNLTLGAANTAFEALNAVPDANGTGFWVLTSTAGSPNFLAYAFNGSGPVTGTAVVTALPNANAGLSGFHRIQISPDLSQILFLSAPNPGQARLYLLDFNAATGQVVPRVSWLMPANSGVAYGADFSPSGRYVYVTTGAGPAATDGLYRYDIVANTTQATLEANAQFVTTNSPFSQIRRGPDGKMYIANTSTSSLSVLNLPEDPNPANVQFQLTGQTLATGTQAIAGLPEFVTGCPLPTTTDLAVTKTDGSATYTPGTNVVYTIVVTNNGPLLATGAQISDPLPAGITTANWTCVAAGGGACGAASGTGALNTTANLPVGATATYTVTMAMPPTATGNLTNIVTVTMAGGDSDPSNNTAQDVDAPAPQADLAVTKTDGSPTFTPGTNVTYAIVVSNTGPSAVTGAVITDALPASITTASWTCGAVTGGGVCGAPSGTGAINTTANLPVNATVTYTLTWTVPSSFAGNLVNTATVAAPVGVTDTNGANNNATDTDTPALQADLAITKASTPNPYVPGAAFSYTIVATNLGPSNVTGATVTDTLPAALALFTWTCAANNGGVCVTPSGTAPAINATVDLPVGGSTTFTVTGTMPPGTTGQLSNTANVAVPAGVTDSVPGNNSATDLNPAGPQADLRITKVSSPNPYVPGQPLTYTIVVTNAGPSNAPGSRVRDTWPAPFASFTWTCAPNGGGAVCQTPSGSGNIDALVDLPAGSSATFTGTGMVPASLTGVVTNTATITEPATVTDPVQGNNIATDNNPTNAIADLAITKAQTPDPYTPGSPLTYTIVVTNNGPSDAPNSRVQDAPPAGLTGVAWTCAASGGGASCATPSGATTVDALVTLPVGTSATFTVTANVPAGQTGVLTNTATVSPASGVTDSNYGNNTATVNSGPAPQADLGILKLVSPEPYRPGTTVAYTITITNAGPSNVVGARVQDTFPGPMSGFTWTCAGTGGATCGIASGASVIDALVNVPVGGVITFSASGIVPVSTTVTVTNVATVTPPLGTNDLNSTNNTSSAVSTPIYADLSITKVDAVDPVNAADIIVYTLTATNAGAFPATNVSVSDPLPAGTTYISASGAGWTCSLTMPTIGCTMPSLGVGPPSTITVTLRAPNQPGVITNTATVTAAEVDPNLANNTASEPTTITGLADLAITKVSTPNPYVPGTPFTYTIIVSNLGPSNVVGAAVNDALPAPLAGFSWTCTANSGAACSAASGTGPSINTLVDLPVGGSTTFLVTGTLASGTVGALVNTARVSSNVPDPVQGNNEATDINPAGPLADLRITKVSSPNPYVPGSPLTYTMVVSNVGPSDALGARVRDQWPAPFSGFTWTCAAASGAACVTPSGAGDIDAIVDLPVGGTATFTASGTVSPSLTGIVTNTATITEPPSVTDPVQGNNAASDNNPTGAIADLAIIKAQAPDPYVPGASLIYTLVVRNNGPSDAPFSRVQDTLPSAVTGVSWTCAPTSGAAVCHTPSGVNVIDAMVSLPSGASATFTITGTVGSSATGTLTNTATITATSTVTDPDQTNNIDTVNSAPSPVVDLAIVKTSTPEPYRPGTAVTYTITVTNTGPSDAIGAQVLDTLPAPMSGFIWTCGGVNGATCATPSGTGNINVLVDVPVGGTITFFASGIPTQTTTAVTNTATVTAPAGASEPNQTNNSASAPSTPILADLSITKVDAVDPVNAGDDIVYTINVSNAGPFPATNVRVDDTLPAATTFVSASGAGWSCGPNGSTLVCTLPSLGIGAATPITVTLRAPNDAQFVTNTAAVSASEFDPDLANNVALQPTQVLAKADLTISKVSTPNPYVPGTALTYTIIVSNVGPSAVADATVVDTMPSALSGVTWTCTPNTGGTTACGSAGGSGDINATVNLPSGGSVTFLVTGTVDPSTTGVLTNTATVTEPAGVFDPTPGNNEATDVNNANIVADLQVSKTATPSPFVPGRTLTYTIVASNAGPSDVVGGRVQDTFPAAFAGFTWTCVPSTGAVCGTTSGAGNINVLVDLPAGGSATFTSTGTVPSSYTSSANNSVTFTPPTDTHDPNKPNNTTTYENPPALIADLAITKLQSPDPYVPGAGIAYTLLVQNFGPSDVTNARISDTLPGVITGATWTCAAAGTGASCATATGVNVVDALVTLPVGTTATFTISGTALPSATGIVSNIAQVTEPVDVTDPVPGNNQSTVNSGGAPLADLSVVKTASMNPYVSGQPLSFTIVVSNAGPSDVPHAHVQDLFPAALSDFTWSCAPTAGAAACTVPSGLSMIDTYVDLPVGGAVTFTVTGTVAPDTSGPLTNTATVAPPIGINDPNHANNLSAVTLGANALADLSLTKTSAPNPYVPGSPITYTIVASNAGPSTLFGGRVRDGLPAVLQNPTWTCSAVNGTCPAASGSGNLDALVDIGPGGTVTFTITALVPAGTSGRLTNAATILPPAGTGDPNPNNNSAVEFNPSLPTPTPVDLQITQEFPGVAPPNGLLTFRLRTRNLGSGVAINPYITGMIPPGTTFVSVTPSAGGIANTPGNPPAPDPVTGYPIPGAATVPLLVTWPGLMKPGESHVVEFTVRVAPGTPTGQILWSCFWTWPQNEDVHHPNNVIDAYLFVHDGTSPVGDLSVQAGALSEGVVGTTLPTRVGVPVPMRFWATNHGPAATRGQYALILDTANTIEIVDVQLAQGWVSPSGPSSGVWDTGVVQPGQTVALDMTVRLLTPSAVELFAQRITGSPGDPNATNERATIVLDGYAPGMAGRWVAVGNVDGAGAGEILTGAGQGETPQVRVFTGTGADTGMRFFAYERPFTGGVQLASCDVNGDGVAELITAPGPGRAPTIRVLSLVGGVVTELIAFDAFETGFLGGASVACADLDADGKAEVVVGAGPGRAPEVQVYNVGLSSVTPRASFLAYEAGFLGGVRVAAGVYPGRAGWLDAFGIATTPGVGRAPELRLWTPTGAPVAQVVVSSATKGVLPTLGDVNGDGQLDLLLSPDDGRPELIRIFEIDSGEVMGDVPGNLPAFPVGIRTAVGVLSGGPGQPEIVIGNGLGGHPRVRVIYWPPAGPVQRLEILPLEIP